jgi:NADH-quinone oxidoreductase subunit C
VSSHKLTLQETLQSKHSDIFSIVEMAEDNKVSLKVKVGDILTAAKMIRDEYSFKIPIACGGVDYPSENRIHLIYYVENPESRLVLFLRIDLDRTNPKIPSLTGVWEAMSFHEREAHEMFGVEFEDHPNMIPLLLSPDWKGGYPLRKDFKGEGSQ